MSEPPQFLPEPEQCEILTRLFTQHYGSDCTSINRLKGDASARSIFRLTSAKNTSVIGVYGPHPEENRAFLAFTKEFMSAKLPVPQLLSSEDSGFAYLLEDLGDETLFLRLNSLRGENHRQFPSDAIGSFYREAVQQLVQFQTKVHLAPLRQFCYQGDVFDGAAWQRDHQYFLNMFVATLHPDKFDRKALSEEFTQHYALLSDFPKGYFLYRDFQSRNIMVTPLGLRFLDYQSGREGSPVYDIASLLYDARANLPEDFRQELRELHCEVFSDQTGVKPKILREAFAPYALLRILQALGSYGNNGIKQRKPGYADSIPFGIQNALTVLETDTRLRKFTNLQRLLTRIAEQESWINLLS
ncbi:MAG: phosphotransferase [bacterium]|nr:phosphotransferase [bacterium]